MMRTAKCVLLLAVLAGAASVHAAGEDAPKPESSAEGELCCCWALGIETLDQKEESVTKRASRCRA